MLFLARLIVKDHPLPSQKAQKSLSLQGGAVEFLGDVGQAIQVGLDFCGGAKCLELAPQFRRQTIFEF
jgi:hypothetical protein